MRALIGYRFGGLRKRDGRSELRTIDPVLQSPVFLRTELHSENWLTRRLNPAVADVQVPTEPLRALIDGIERKAKVSLLVTMKSGEKVADIVVKKLEHCAWHPDAAVVAAAHGYELCFRDRAQLRANHAFTMNLKTIRQRCVLWADLPGPIDESSVLQCLALHPLPRIELFHVLADTRPTLHIEQLDCLLFQLRLSQRVFFDLGEPYGDATRIARV